MSSAKAQFRLGRRRCRALGERGRGRERGWGEVVRSVSLGDGGREVGERVGVVEEGALSAASAHARFRRSGAEASRRHLLKTGGPRRMLVNRRSAGKGEQLAPSATSLVENRHWDTGGLGRAKRRPCTARGRRTVFFSSMAELVADDRFC